MLVDRADSVDVSRSIPIHGVNKDTPADIAGAFDVLGAGYVAGSITAALFLFRFVERTRNWAHFDVYGWTPSARPGHIEGGEIQMAHGLFDLLATRYGYSA